jgi:hypothetical protein
MTLPKLAEDGVAEIAGWVPVPLSEIDTGVLDALSVTEMLPDAFPAAVGAKVAEKDLLWLAAIVTGSDRPEIEKPVPEVVACDTVRLAEPELVSVIV